MFYIQDYVKAWIHYDLRIFAASINWISSKIYIRFSGLGFSASSTQTSNKYVAWSNGEVFIVLTKSIYTKQICVK